LAMAPAIGPAFTREGLAPVKIPVAIVVGSADSITPAEEHAERYAKLIGGAKLAIIPHAGHMVFCGGCSSVGQAELRVLCVDDPAVERHQVLQTVSADALSFFNASLGVVAGEE